MQMSIFLYFSLKNTSMTHKLQNKSSFKQYMDVLYLLSYSRICILTQTLMSYENIVTKLHILKVLSPIGWYNGTHLKVDIYSFHLMYITAIHQTG